MQVCVRIFVFSIQLNVKILLQTSVVINKLNVSFYYLINLILIPNCLTYPSFLFSLGWLLFDDCCYVDVLKFNTICLTTVSIFFISIEYHSIWRSGVKFRKFILKCLHVYFRIIFEKVFLINYRQVVPHISLKYTVFFKNIISSLLQLN